MIMARYRDMRDERGQHHDELGCHHDEQRQHRMNNAAAIGMNTAIADLPTTPGRIGSNESA